MVLRVNEWMVSEGYEPFAIVVEVEKKRYRLDLLSDDGVPRVPSLEGVIEFMIGMSTGDVEKGGSREARSKDWYASQLWGKSQAELSMPMDKKGKYGWGVDKDLPYRLDAIKSHVTALRQWLQEQLRGFDKSVANPMHDGWVDAAMQHLTREIGCGRRVEKLPVVLPDATVRAMVKHADVTNMEEMQTTSYVGTNVVHGTRAHDNALLDRRDSIMQEADRSSGQRAGRKINHVSTKNNKAQASRPKGLPCRTGCCGSAIFTDDGGLKADEMCPNCMLDFAEKQVDDKLGATAEVAAGLPQYVDAKELGELEAGCNLVRCERVADQQGAPGLLVCSLTPKEHADGMGYDGAVPFVIDGKVRRPPVRGTWFEVPQTGCAIRVWSDAIGVSRRLQKQLRKTNKRAGYEVMAPALIKKVTSKSMRRTMATKLTRLMGLDAAVEMGEWSSRAMAKLYVEEADALATATYNPTDVLLGCVAAEEQSVIVQAVELVVPPAAEEMAVATVDDDAPADLQEMARWLAAFEQDAIAEDLQGAAVAEDLQGAAVAGDLQEVALQGAATEQERVPPQATSLTLESGEDRLRASLEHVLNAVVSGAQAPTARVPYGTKEVPAGVRESRERHAAVCCPERCGGNPLKRKAIALYAGVEQCIDSMASNAPRRNEKEIWACTAVDQHVDRPR